MNPTTTDLLRRLGVAVPRIMLPDSGIDLYRWAVIACDQHTSEPDYWEEVEQVVDDRPSTLHLIYPEVYLGEADADARIRGIHDRMEQYVSDGTVRELEPAMILTRRSTPHVSERRGLMLTLDLEQYDYTPGAQSLTRATEQTIVERIPPRVRIRKGASLEVPHVMVLIDDPSDELFGGLLGRNLERLYSTQLMLGGGEVAGYRVAGDALDHVAGSLERLLAQSSAPNPFLFAVGDGNHSLATAKAVWDDMKDEAPADHPARYALVEVVNLYDPGLRFEPIHRLVRTDDPTAWVAGLARTMKADTQPCAAADLRRELGRSTTAVGYVTDSACGLIQPGGSTELPVAAVQSYIDEQAASSGGEVVQHEVDYIHGWDTSLQLGRTSGSVGVLLPAFSPQLLYPTVTRRGVLPRKAFSLGEAEEKRYYLEARGIS